MITEMQLKNVITYYYLDLMRQSCNNIQAPTNSTRDTISFNKMRAEICGNTYNIPKLKQAIGIIHNSTLIQQVNSIPKNSECCIDKVKIPLSESGVQLICKQEDESIHHIVFQKKYQQICISYFKLRWFNELLQEKIRQFLLEQPWYLPNTYQTNDILKKIFNSNFCKIVYKDLEITVDFLDGF